MIIDAHQHCWDLAVLPQTWLEVPEKLPIRRSFLPDDLRPSLRQAGVGRTILVQTSHDPAENRWALDLADRHAWIAGVVGWVDLAAADCADQMRAFMAHPKAVGIRHLVQDEADDAFLLRPAIIAGLRVLENHGVPFDLLIHPRHLRHVPALARQLPRLPLVIDHLAKPDLRRAPDADWIADLRAAAACPNVHAKLSGLVTEADWSRWTVADLRPAVAAAVAAFGPERLMFGSDWPVCLLAAGYQRWFDTVQTLISDLAADARAQVMGGTAARFYRLG